MIGRVPESEVNQPKDALYSLPLLPIKITISFHDLDTTSQGQFRFGLENRVFFNQDKTCLGGSFVLPNSDVFIDSF